MMVVIRRRLTPVCRSRMAILSKVCRGCKRRKPLDDYYNHPRMSDGHLNFCKECVKPRVRANYQRTRKRYKKYDKEREKRPERKAMKKEYEARYREVYPEKYRAHMAVGNAVRAGRLMRRPCEVCGNKAEAHHDDYSKPLDVRWLCFTHHRMHHGQMKHLAKEG